MGEGPRRCCKIPSATGGTGTDIAEDATLAPAMPDKDMSCDHATLGENGSRGYLSAEENQLLDATRCTSKGRYLAWCSRGSPPVPALALMLQRKVVPRRGMLALLALLQHKTRRKRQRR